MQKIDPETLRRIFEYSSDIISIHDMEGTFLEISPACEELLGYTREELLGISPYDLFHPDDHEKVFMSYSQIEEPPHIHKVDYRIKHRDGSYIWFESTSSLMQESSDDEPRVVSFSRDITKRKKAESDLESALETREQLLEILSHDLRNSFQALQVLSLLLAEDLEQLQDEEIREYSQDIHTSTIRVNELLNNMINWSKAHKDELACNPEELQLREVLAEVLELYRKQTSNKNLDIDIDLQEPGTIYADPDMCNSIFRNLLSNAIKFSNEGGNIDIEHIDGSDHTTVRITDRGVGMKQEKADELFSEETKSEKGTMGESGTGIGLGLCRDFVRKHGGRIWADSKPGEGTTITFELPKKS